MASDLDSFLENATEHVESAYTCTFCKVNSDLKLAEAVQDYADRRRKEETRVGVERFFRGYVKPRMPGVRLGLDAFRRHLRDCCGIGPLRGGGGRR